MKNDMDIYNSEVALCLYREFLKEHEEFISHDGEPSFTEWLLIRIRNLRAGENKIPAPLVEFPPPIPTHIK